MHLSPCGVWGCDRATGSWEAGLPSPLRPCPQSCLPVGPLRPCLCVLENKSLLTDSVRQAAKDPFFPHLQRSRERGSVCPVAWRDMGSENGVTAWCGELCSCSLGLFECPVHGHTQHQGLPRCPAPLFGRSPPLTHLFVELKPGAIRHHTGQFHT